MNEDLRQWLRQRWVDISRKKKDGGHPACGASAGKGTRAKDSSKKYPKCVPASKAKSMSKKEKQSAVRRKRQADNKPGKPDFVKTKTKKEELNLLEKQMKLDNLLEFLMEEKISEQTDPATGLPVNPPTPPVAVMPPAGAGTGTPAGGGLMMNPAVPAPPAPPAGAAGTAVPAPGTAVPAPGAAGTVSAPQGSTAPSVITTPAAVQTPTQQPVPGQSATTPPVAAPAGGLPPLPPLPPLAEDLSALTEEQLLEILTSEKLDPVGHEDSDINNDGIENDRTDDYLRHRREVRSKAIKSSLSESVKYQELQNQERRRKSLIKVQNKIIYAKK
jgi:hypothetical protein